MKLDRIFLILSGLLCVAAAFFPFFHSSYLLDGHMSPSGYNYVMATLGQFGVVSFEQGTSLPDMIWNLFNSASQPMDYLMLAGLGLVLAGPVIFALYGLGYILRGLRGKQYRNGIFFAILFLGLSWATLYFLSPEMVSTLFGGDRDTPINFFGLAGLGYWMGFGGMIAAAFSLFFAKNLE
ncbi:MAG: hypothetical protein AAFR61_17355 [Bacteroidota bacterium]